MKLREYSNEGIRGTDTTKIVSFKLREYPNEGIRAIDYNFGSEEFFFDFENDN